MTETLKPFDRKECFQIFLKLIESSKGNATTFHIERAILLAQDFAKSIPAKINSFTIPATTPSKVNGSFGAMGKCLYFIQDNGNETLICEYPEPASALGMAIALNSISEAKEGG